MLPDDDAVLKLAHRRAVEEEAFEGFLTALRHLFRKSWLSTTAGIGTLAAYLEWRDSQSGNKAERDEQSVVAPLVRQLLEALGYEEGEGFTYNRALPSLQARAVPDYTVYAREFLASTPAFLVECKATSVTLHGSQGSPLAQLRRYVLSGVVHGRVGLLCNGRSLEAWDFGSDGGTRLVHLDLERLARIAENTDEEWPGDQASALHTFWSRFSRQAFVQAQDLHLLSAQAPPLPEEWIAKVRARFEEGARAGDLETDLVRYYESVWLQDAVDVSAAPELLVETLRGLIQQFSEDVLHQLSEALRRYEDFEQERRELETKSRLPWLRQSLAARRAQNFELTQEEFDRLLLKPLDDWTRRPRLEDVDERVAEWLAALAPHFKVTNDDNKEQLALGPAKEPKKPRRNQVEARKKQTLTALENALKEYARQALEEFAAGRQIEGEHRSALKVAQAYQTWASRVSSSVLVGAEESVYRREFALQTAYVYIIRLLLVRICEDKKIFQRKLSDGGLILWQECAGRYLDYAAGQSYEYLTQMAYECAQNVYVHFYGASELFDWYRMDDKMMLRALLVLNAFNLESIDRDIIGAVYGRYLEEGKHEQGRYYTPRELVRTMLDLAGYSGEGIVNRRIGDLACGSGSFLVEACRRLLDQFRGSDGKIPTPRLAPALEEVQKSLYGIEINPFACYLAETNLLIQVLDLIRQAQEEDLTLTVDRFQIYSGDALLVDERLAGVSDTTLFLLGSDRANLEQLKARTGPFLDGFDFLVGNPPYVRADEDAPAYLSYRRVLERQGWFTTRHQKWDLYVRWMLLQDVENRSLSAARKALAKESRYEPALSKNFSEWYLCALALSQPVQQWLTANKRSMKEDVYPDDIKAIPVKRLPPEKQQPFIELEQERHRLWRELIALESEGFRLGARVEVPVHRLVRRFCDENPDIECLALHQIPASMFEIAEGFIRGISARSERWTERST